MAIRLTFVILLVAILIPLVYRDFVDDSLRSRLLSYDKRLKVVDSTLRDAADKIHELKKRAFENLPAREVIQKEFDSKLKLALVYAGEAQTSARNWLEINVIPKINELIETIKQTAQNSRPESKPKKESTTASPKTTGKIIPIDHTRRPEKSTCQDGSEGVRLWSSHELSQFDGKKSDDSKVHLAFLGIVYDVSLNKQHYGKDGEYNVFAGRDASKAFVTGDFTNDLTDKVDGLDKSQIGQLDTWRSFYKSSYPTLGRLVGNFYDSKGCPTEALKEVEKRLYRFVRDEQENSHLPDCNSEWNSETKKGRVWCTNKSGGVEREWAGFPRIYTHEDSQKRCACFDPDFPETKSHQKNVEFYPGCPPFSSECSITQRRPVAS